MTKMYPELCQDPYCVQQLNKKWMHEAMNPQLGLLSFYYTELYNMLYKMANITIDKPKSLLEQYIKEGRHRNEVIFPLRTESN